MSGEPFASMNGEPIHRTRSDEATDSEQVLQNLMTGLYEDWPNDAGFDGLEEHRGPIQLRIRGIIPSWVAGTLFRTGPGMNRVDKVTTTDETQDGTYHISHWFDGLAHTHRFDIVPEAAYGPSPGCVRTKVLYSSRRQSDEMVQHIQKNKKGSRMVTFAQRDDPCIGLFAKFMSSWAVANNARTTKKIENLAVTVQTDVPGFAPEKDVSLNGSNPSDSSDCNSGHKPPAKPTVWLASDTNTMRQIDARTLEPIGVARQVAVHPSLTGPLSCAHAQRCPETGDWYNFNLTVGSTPTYRIFRVSAATGETDILATISKPDLKITYVHSFFLSKRFVILRLPSSTIGSYGLGILWHRNLLDAIEPFEESRTCKWFVIDRLHGTGVVAEFETPAAFFFHAVNCFDELVEPNGNDRNSHTTRMADVYCDVIDYPSTGIMYSMYYDVILNREGKAKAVWGDVEKAKKNMSKLVRWKLRVPAPRAPRVPPPPQQQEEERNPLAVSSSKGLLGRLFAALSAIRAQDKPKPGLLSPEIILSIPAPHVGDLPTINPAFHTRPIQYIYSLAYSGHSTTMDTLVKTDLLTGDAVRWNSLEGHFPGEAIFVSRPRGAGGSGAEDDGVLLSVVLDGFEGTSYLLCLDARTMRELGRAEMEFAVGIGFHGVYSADRI